MKKTLSAQDVTKAAEWFATAAAYPEENKPPAQSNHSVKRWIDDPGALLQARDKVEYTYFFDIGTPEPLAPLIESHYQQDKQARLRQIVTFYRTYGVINETEFPPDHLCVELAFLGFLASLASDYPEREDLSRAYGSFSKVHLGPWLGTVTKVIKKEAPDSAWITLFEGISKFLDEVTSRFEIPAEDQPNRIIVKQVG